MHTCLPNSDSTLGLRLEGLGRAHAAHVLNADLPATDRQVVVMSRRTHPDREL